MKSLTTSKADIYTPTTDAALNAAGSFIEKQNIWSKAFGDAKAATFDLVRKHAQAPVRGMLASDPLNMTVFGFMFDGNPGPGFLATPGKVNDSIAAQGLRGAAYFPDASTPVGSAILEKINAINAIAETRPLLKTIPGVRSIAIEGGNLVLTTAAIIGSKVCVIATPAAVSPTAELRLSAPALASVNDATTDRPVANKRPSPRG